MPCPSAAPLIKEGKPACTGGDERRARTGNSPMCRPWRRRGAPGQESLYFPGHRRARPERRRKSWTSSIARIDRIPGAAGAEGTASPRLVFGVTVRSPEDFPDPDQGLKTAEVGEGHSRCQHQANRVMRSRHHEGSHRCERTIRGGAPGLSRGASGLSHCRAPDQPEAKGAPGITTTMCMTRSMS